MKGQDAAVGLMDVKVGLGGRCPSLLWSWMTFGKSLSLFYVSDFSLSCLQRYNTFWQMFVFCPMFLAELQFYFESEVNWCWQINYRVDTLASLVYKKYFPTVPLCIPNLEGFLSSAIKHVQGRLHWGRRKKTVCKSIFSCIDNLISRMVYSSLLALFLDWCFFGFFFFHNSYFLLFPLLG